MTTMYSHLTNDELLRYISGNETTELEKELAKRLERTLHPEKVTDGNVADAKKHLRSMMP